MGSQSLGSGDPSVGELADEEGVCVKGHGRSRATRPVMRILLCPRILTETVQVKTITKINPGTSIVPLTEAVKACKDTPRGTSNLTGTQHPKL